MNRVGLAGWRSGALVIAAGLVWLASTMPGQASPPSDATTAAETGTNTGYWRVFADIAVGWRWRTCLTPIDQSVHAVIADIMATWRSGGLGQAAPTLVSATCDKLVFTVGNDQRIAVGRGRDGRLLGGGLDLAPPSAACVQDRRAALMTMPFAKAIVEAIEAKNREGLFDLDVGPYKYISCGDDQTSRDATFLHEGQHGLDRDSCFFSAFSGQWRCLGGINTLPPFETVAAGALGISPDADAVYQGVLAMYLRPTRRFRNMVSELAAYTVSARVQGMERSPGQSLVNLPLFCLLHVRYLRALKAQHPSLYPLLSPGTHNRVVLDELLREAEGAMALAAVREVVPAAEGLLAAERETWAVYLKERDALHRDERAAANEPARR